MTDQRKNSTSSVINPNNKNSLSLSFLHKKRHSDSSIEASSNNSQLTTPKHGLSKTNSTSSIPKLVRKKSGELVKSNLKLNCLMNGESMSKSMPTTPLYKKGVHFGQDVDVRYFNEKDKPTAVSANTSPILRGRSYKHHYGKHKHKQKNHNRGGALPQNNFSNEYGYGLNSYDYNYDSIEDDDSSDWNDSDDSEEDNDDAYIINWDLDNINFEKIKYNEKIHTEKSKIFLERISLDEEDDCILGLIAVKNLSFEKKIHIRYTFDHWKTVIEIESAYMNDVIPKVLKRSNYDRFRFKIPLQNFKFMMENQIKIFFCIRYRYKNTNNSNEIEIWDNNHHKNYEIELTKTKKKKFKKNHKFSLDNFGSNSNTQHSMNDSYFNNYEFNLTSPETPKVLKISDDDIPPFNSDFDLTANDVSNSIQNKLILEPEDYFNLNASEHIDPPTANLNTSSTPKQESIDPLNNENTQKPNNIVYNTTNKTNNINNNNSSPQMTSIAQNFKLNRNHKPMINSKSYQELLDSYCFFKSGDQNTNLNSTVNNEPSSISTYLDQTINKH